MGTPALSSNTEALSNAPIADSDDEGPQSSMWVQQEGHTSSELPSDFLEPLSPGVEVVSPLPPFPTRLHHSQQQSSAHESRQFWKSGDFTGSYDGATFATEGMDHARVHPKFLHSNATSHKWVLGAIAELLDNAVDEIRNGATFVKVDVIPNPRNGEPMLVIEDDGGGMDPDCMRRCMSLGYSAKSKLSNTIGQYGNGFKTSTMRLGADVMVFSRSGVGKPSESIGMMSYTFLTTTGQNDIIVPIVDFQIEAFGIRKLIRSNVEDWVESMEAIESWSPYSSQAELVNQFKTMSRRQGTRVIIYNLWEDEEGLPELDFTADPTDIQIRSTTRDEKTLKMAARYASCWHYLTHRHSLRSYTSILYLRLPSRFRIFMRGKQVLHHSLRNEMMLVEEVTYRPKDAGHSKAVVTLGFVKDAREHLDISGFNVYHKNRLIKPFWRIWNPSDTRGRGIIGILEANFVEPAHDKQGFERTIVLSRLEARLVEMQKSYFSKNCHRIGYTNANSKKHVRPDSADNSRATNGGMLESEQRKAQYMSMVDSAVTDVRSSANGVRDVSHVQSIGMEPEPEPLLVSSALMLESEQRKAQYMSMVTNGGMLESEQRKAQYMSIVDSAVTNVRSSANGVRDVSHVQSIGKEPEPLLVSSALMLPPMHEVSVTPARLEMQEHLNSIDSTTSGVGKHNRGFLGRQDSAYVAQEGVSSDKALSYLQHGALNSARLDSQPFYAPVSSDVSLSNLKITSLGPHHLSSSMGMASSVIDLDSPDNDRECDGAAFEIPSLDNCDATKPISKDCLPELFNLMRGASASESMIPSREMSDDITGCLEGNESSELIDASSSFPALAESLGMESCAPLSEIVPTSKEAPSTMSIPGFNDTPRIQTNEDRGELVTESFLQGETVIANASCQDITMIDAAGVEVSDPPKSSSISAEGHVFAVFELDDLLDSPIPQDEVQPLSPPVKARDASVSSLVVDVDATLPDILENAFLENDTLLPFNSSESLNRNAIIVGIERDSNVAQENPTDDCQLPHKDVVKDSASVESLSRRDIQQVARVVTETDATAINDFEEQGDVCLFAKKTSEENNDQHHVSGPVVDQSLATPVTSAENGSGLEQEGRSTLLSHHVIHDVDTSTNNQASSEVIKKDMARVSQEPTSIYNQSLTLGTIQASNKALQQVLVVVHETVPTAVATRDISISSYGDLLSEDGSSRLLFAKQTIESLQQSIEVVVAESDDLREQLLQQRHLQDLDMVNLNIELERALLRLEELKR